MLNKEEIAKVPIIEIIFDGHNKDYGAYDLRKSYNTRLFRATIWVVLGVFGIWLMAILGNDDRIPVMHDVKVQKIEIKQYKKPPTKELFDNRPKPPHTKASKPLLQVNTQHYVAPTIVHDFVLRLEPPKMSIDSMLNSVQAPKLDGINEENITFKVPDMEKESIKTDNIARRDADFDVASMKVQRLPMYIQGLAGWKEFLHKNIHIQIALQNGAMPGPYTATVAFIVHPDSSLSDFKIIRDPGYGMGQEALRVVKMSNKWLPGIKGNKIVAFAQMQDIVFRVKE